MRTPTQETSPADTIIAVERWRHETIAKVDARFWGVISELLRREVIRQVDVAKLLNVSRETVRRNVARVRRQSIEPT